VPKAEEFIVRYLGNKTKLLGVIEEFARQQGARGETFFDCFAGTASVGVHFKKRGYKVTGCDLMRSSYALQVAQLEVSKAPSFRGLLQQPEHRRALRRKALRQRVEAYPSGTPLSLARACALLDLVVEPEAGIMFRNYAPGGSHGRRYFRDEHAQRLDGWLLALRSWLRDGVLAEEEFYLLLSAVLGAADRVANIAGVYAAYLKNWQSNTRGELRLRPPLIIPGPKGRAFLGDSNELVGEHPCDILYIDPPYNSRQYAAYYHVREIMSEFHVIDDLDEYESRLYGKTGLRPYDDLKSHYCVRRKREGRSVAEQALRDLLSRARARHIIISYSEEGIISREGIAAALAEYSGVENYDYAQNHMRVGYKRFRSDADGHNGRSYRILDGRNQNEVNEWLFYGRAPALEAQKRA